MPLLSTSTSPHDNERRGREGVTRVAHRTDDAARVGVVEHCVILCEQVDSQERVLDDPHDRSIRLAPDDHRLPIERKAEA